MGAFVKAARPGRSGQHWSPLPFGASPSCVVCKSAASQVRKGSDVRKLSRARPARPRAEHLQACSDGVAAGQAPRRAQSCTLVGVHPGAALLGGTGADDAGRRRPYMPVGFPVVGWCADCSLAGLLVLITRGAVEPGWCALAAARWRWELLTRPGAGRRVWLRGISVGPGRGTAVVRWGCEGHVSQHSPAGGRGRAG